MALAAADFDFVSEVARRSAAIVLERGKEYLVENRLTPLAQREGFASLGDLIGALRAPARSRDLCNKVVDALTTNETFFFRDQHPFDALRTVVLPKLIGSRSASRELRIWSAACSSGQEAFSIAMLLQEYFPQLISWKVEILATDISPTILARARSGLYSQVEVSRGLPSAYLDKYFTKQNDQYQIHGQLRTMVDFRPLNLIADWPNHPPFDIVFMRNVMIYFDPETKRSLLRKLRSSLHPTGHLILGAAETTINLDPTWLPVTHDKATLYQQRAQS